MTLPETSIRRPVMTTLIMAALILFGVFAYRALPVSELPNVDFPTIQVTARLPGASPETMASSVAQPLEAQLARIAGVETMSSTSALGLTNVTLTFELSRDIDSAALDVQTAISSALRNLPDDMPNPPSFRKVNPADFAILLLAIQSDTLPISEVNNYAETMLAQRLSSIGGVAQVTVFGSQKYAVRVQVDPNALAARGIGIDEVADGVKAANQNKATGTLDGASQSLTIRTTGQLADAAEFNRQVVIWRNGAPVRVQDIGRAVDSVENDKLAAWYNAERGIILGVYRQPGSNTVETVDAIKRILPQFAESLPAAVKLDVLYDRTQTIRHAIDDVQFTLVLASALVVMVIFLFLRNLSATVIPSLALPISVIGTFAAMWYMGYSLNNLTLMALTLSVGFVVDDAIVMLENIVRHMEKGKSAFRAAVDGAREIAFTILSMTASLAIVFIPLIFMGGMVGRLLHEFAVTICAAILVSGLVSMTLTPMLCSRFVRPERKDRQQGWLYRASERGFAAMNRGYERTLDWCLKRHRLVFAAFVATVVGTFYLYAVVPKDLLPPEDSNQLVAFTEGAQDASFEAMVRNQQIVKDILLKDPNVEGMMSSVGVGGSRVTGNTGFLFLRLKPRSERKLSAEQLIPVLRAKTAGVPGIRVFFQNPPPIRIGGMFSKAQYQYTLQDMDLETLYKGAGVMQREMGKLDILRDVTSDMQLTSPNLVLHIDRDRAASLGVSVEQIQTALGTAFGSQQVSTIYTPSEQYQVILEVTDEFQRDASALNRLYVRARSGALVPIAAVAEVKRETGPLTVNHLGQLPSVTVSFNLAPGVTLGTAIEAIKGVEEKTGLPYTTTTSFQGAAKAFKSSFQGMGLLLAMALIAVYIVLGILYESFIHPLTILSGLPSAGVGALLTLLVFDVPLTLYAFVGIIMLIGIVKKNAIMMIDFALVAERRDGKDPADAIREACLVRFRPIMMTTMAALMGALPIALGAGSGAESRRPLGLTVVGGLLLSQVLTLYLTPVIYLYLDKLRGLNAYRRLAVLPEGTEAAPAGEGGTAGEDAPAEEPRRARLRRVAGSDD